MKEYFLVADKYEAISLTIPVVEDNIVTFEPVLFECLTYESSIYLIKTDSNSENLSAKIQEYNDHLLEKDIVDYLTDYFEEVTLVFSCARLNQYSLTDFKNFVDKGWLDYDQLERLQNHPKLKSIFE